MNKRLVYFSFSLLMAFTISYFIHNKNEEKNYSVSSSETVTFKKNKNRSIASYTTPVDEKMDANILKKKQFLKEVNKPVIKNPNYFYYKDYRLIGSMAKKWHDSDKKLKMENIESKDWKNQLGESLLSFQSSDTKVIIDEEDNIIKLNDDAGTYMKLVSVHFLFANGETRAFKALVNAESGKIEETWDNPIHEKKINYNFELQALRDSKTN